LKASCSPPWTPFSPFDEDQSIVLFNEAAEVMFECRAQEAIGGPLDRFIPARFRAAHRDHIVAFGESGTTSRRMGVLGQVWALTAHGEEFPVEAAISQIAVDGKKYFTVILRDLRERERLKRAEAELRQSEERLRKATKSGSRTSLNPLRTPSAMSRWTGRSFWRTMPLPASPAIPVTNY
jgi:PAS domain S-box-containing protein